MPFKINYSPRRNLKTPSRFFENAFTFDVKCLYLCCKTNTLAYEIKKCFPCLARLFSHLV